VREVNQNGAELTVLKRFNPLLVKNTNLLRFVVRSTHRTSKVFVKPFVYATSVKHVSARESHRLVSRPIFYKTYGTVGCVTDAYIETIEGRETTLALTNKG
jgi:hypothetical protein